MNDKLLTITLAVLLLPLFAYAQQTVTQDNPDWGLDRVDQRSSILDTKYIYDWTGNNVRIYVLDSGVNASHVDFGNRVVGAGDFIKQLNGSDTDDCNGHGTRVAGVAAGEKWGVAKLAEIWSMKTTPCSGVPSRPAIKEALDELIDDETFNGANLLAVVNLSAELQFDDDINDKVTVLASESGISFVHAAGNSDADACNASPTSVHAISIAASTPNDARWPNSNTGSCVDIFAPGEDIESAAHDSTTGAAVASGTSMSAPFVAGKVALFLHEHQFTSANTIKQRITTYNATHNVLAGIGTGTPNKLVHTRSGLYRPGIHVSFSACDESNNAVYTFTSNGDYGPESEFYTREIDIGGTGSWDELDASTDTFTVFRVPSFTQFRVRARYTVSLGTADDNTSGMITAPDCSGGPSI